MSCSGIQTWRHGSRRKEAPGGSASLWARTTIIVTNISRFTFTLSDLHNNSMSKCYYILLAACLVLATTFSFLFPPRHVHTSIGEILAKKIWKSTKYESAESDFNYLHILGRNAYNFNYCGHVDHIVDWFGQLLAYRRLVHSNKSSKLCGHIGRLFLPSNTTHWTISYNSAPTGGRTLRPSGT